MRDYLKFYRLSDATFYDCINNVYIILLNFSWIKISIFEEYGAFNDDKKKSQSQTWIANTNRKRETQMWIANV